MLDKGSPFTLSAAQLTLTIAYFRHGVCLSYSGIFLEYFRAMLTREFDTGIPHVFGGIQIGTAITTNK